LDATVLSYAEIRETIVSMGADYSMVVRENKVMYVAFYRSGGCGRLHVNVCNYLAKRFHDMEIVVLESPTLNRLCHKARVRRPGGMHFSPSPEPVLATASRLGVL